MHAVQTFTRLRAPETKARTDFRLGFQRRRRVLLAWLTTLPKLGPLPQYSHFIAMILPIGSGLIRERNKYSKGLIGEKAVPFGTSRPAFTRRATFCRAYRARSGKSGSARADDRYRAMRRLGVGFQGESGGRWLL